jgi:hypothetical protein
MKKHTNIGGIFDCGTPRAAKRGLAFPFRPALLESSRDLPPTTSLRHGGLPCLQRLITISSLLVPAPAWARWPRSWRRRGGTFCCLNGAATCGELETVCEIRRTRASFTSGPGGIEDGWSSESVRVMPFYCSKRSASICVVLGPKKSLTYSSEYASGFSEPAASHLPAAPLLRNEGLLGQTPSPIARRR